MATRAAGLGQAISVEELARRLKTLPKALHESLLRALVQGQEQGLRVALDELRQRGIAASLWGLHPKSATRRARKPRLWTPQARAQGDKLTGVIAAFGLAAMVELGGRTVPHDIPRIPKRGRGGRLRPMVFSGPGGQVFASRVKHPGGPIPKRPYLHVGQEAMAERFGVAAEREMQFVLDRVVG